MSTSATLDEHGAKDGATLRFWRLAFFGSIGVLYLASLYSPPLREALATVFSYFPR